MSKPKFTITIPGTDYSRVRSGVRPSLVIEDKKVRAQRTRKVKHKKPVAHDQDFD